MRRWMVGGGVVVVVLLMAVGESILGRPDGHNAKGRDAMSRGDYRTAVTEFGEAVRLAPGEAKYHYNLGLAFAQMRHLDSAEAQFREALRIAPGDLEASRALSITRARIEARAQP